MLSVTVILLSKIQNHPTNQFVGNLDKLYIACARLSDSTVGTY